MTIEWSPTSLVAIDEDIDRERASNGRSRLGSYLASKRDGLFDEDRTDPTQFLVWAWSVATPPLMSPGYVSLRPDLQAVRLTTSEDDGALIVEVVLPLHHGALDRQVRPPYDVADWETSSYDFSGDRYQAQMPPSNDKRPAVLLAATVLVPAGDWDLYVPSDGDNQLLDDARQAVERAVRLVNERGGPYVAGLLGESR